MKNSASPSLDNGYGRTRTCGPKGEEVTSLFFGVTRHDIQTSQKHNTREIYTPNETTGHILMQMYTKRGNRIDNVENVFDTPTG